MNRKSSLFLGMAVLLTGRAFSAEALSDHELAESIGMDGISMQIELRANADANGAPISTAPFNNCVGNNNPCRLGLEFAGRPGQWVMLKDYYFLLRYVDLLLDSGSTPNASTPYRNLSRFRDSAGNQLLADPNNRPALVLSFPAKTGYQDIRASLTIGRVAAEFDATGSCTGAGYLCDNATGSVLGLKISNMAGQAAGINVDGKMLIFGF
ncbi:MAG: hypothetical protein Q8J78_11960 [Moraxellaceae bacterium]|nr:hypothetical protein [Moraxellaceae bacterium]